MQQQINKAKKASSLLEAVAVLDSLQFNYKTWLDNDCHQADSISAEVVYRYASLYYHNDQIEKGIPYLEKAIRLHECTSISHFRIAKLYQTLGNFHLATNGFEKAEKAYNKSILLKKELADPSISNTYNDIANLKMAIGDYQNAAFYINEAISVSKLQKDNDYKLANYALTSSIILSKQNKYKEALSIADTAYHHFSLFEKDADILEKLADVNMQKGDIYVDLGKQGKALQYYKKSEVGYESIEDKASLVTLYNNLGRCLKSIPNKEIDAIEYLNKSIQTCQNYYEIKYDATLAAMYNNIADIHSALGNTSSALEQNHLALQQLLPTYRDRSLYTPIDLKQMPIIGLKTEALIILDSLASNYQTLFKQTKDYRNIAASLNIYEEASVLIDMMRSEHIAVDSKIWWREQTKSLFERAIETALLAKKMPEAFEFCEKSKSILLLDALNVEDAKQFISDKIVQKLEAIKKDISVLKLKQTTRSNNKNSSTEIIEKNRALEQLMQEIKEQYPKYYDYAYDVNPVNLSSIQQEVLGSQTTMVEYFLTDDLLYAFILNQEGFDVKTIPLDVLFFDHAKQLINTLKNKDKIETNAGYQAYVQSAQYLYEHLIVPLNLNKEKLILIPDGILNYIPFESLVTNTTNEKPTYLLEECMISYAYSATILAKNLKKKSSNSPKILAIAPQIFDNFTQQLGPLMESEKEIDQIAKLFPDCKKVIGKQATKLAFESLSSQYDILHISSHASAPDTQESIPWIAFYDSLLYLPEIYHLNLDADLVVLSACETSSGQLFKGEGVMSIARSFAYAGIQSTLTTLWEVSETASFSIIQSFYQYLQEGKTKEAALRQAKLDYIQIVDSPFDWASFILSGNPSALALD